MDNPPVLAVIGGSGLYKFPSLQNSREFELNTPFGKPSSPIITGELNGKKVAFLARHGIGHVYMPSEVNYRANIYALKSIGVKRIVSVSACGSLREDFKPGDIVIPDQLVDLTHKRERTFFGNGIVAHTSTADPFCHNLSDLVQKSLEMTDAVVHHGGTYITIEGPRFSTKGESNLYRQWGMSLIGMTAAPEVFLAREAELCYATMAHITDYDVWHTSEEPVSVEMVIKTLKQNTSIAQEAIENLARMIPEESECDCSHALENAVMTNPEIFPENSKKALYLLIGKYFK
jgi:5'-methylthioadenosine phosphorylase